MRLFATAVLIVLPAAAMAQAAAQSGKTLDKTYAVNGRASVSVAAGEANIRSSSCGGCRNVIIHVDMRDQDLKDYIVEESGTGNNIRFDLKRRSNGWSWSSGRSPEITVQTPAESDVALKTGSGAIDLSGVNGAVAVSSGSGGVHVGNSSGRLDASTGSGGVTADGGFSQFKMRSGSGSVNLTLRPGLQLADSSTVSSGSGSVHLQLPRDLRANVRASTGSGGIHSDLPITTVGDYDSRRNLKGTFNGGGPELHLSTGSGGVHISSL